MELRQLELLRCILDEGSLTSAAQRCHLSQPALSQQIRALEEEVGEPLLVRKPRGVEATAAGALLMKHAARILGEVDRAKETFTYRRELQSGRIVFGIIPTMAPYLLPRLLGPFRQKFPGIDLAVTEARTEELIAQLVAGKIEFGILSDVPAPDRKRLSLRAKELFREPLWLAAPPQHPLATRKSAPKPSDLAARELIHLQSGHCLADQTLRLCRIHETNPGLRCDQLATALAMVEAGLGVSVVPKLAAGDFANKNLVFRPFAGDGLSREVSLLWRKDVRLSPATEALLDLFVGQRGKD